MMTDYLAMGGFAAFVWPSYGLSIFALAALTVWTLRADRRAKDSLGRAAVP